MPLLSPSMSWFVLHIRPRTEKKLAEYCHVHALEHYLPLRRETKIYQRRRVTVEKPLFPGYFFVAFTPDQRALVLMAHYIVNILTPPDETTLVHELDQIRLALDIDPSLGASAAIQKGRRVRITAGPFMGVEGTVDTLHGPAKVRLNVEMIGQAVAVDVERAFVEPIDD